MRGAGALRMADALLRSVGGREVLLRMPAPAFAGDVAEQLGLAAPAFQDSPLGPVVMRRVEAHTTKDGTQYELLVSASAVSRIVGSLEYGSADVLFAQAYGVVVDGALLEIEAATSAEAFGTVYLYRLRLDGALKDRV